MSCDTFVVLPPLTAHGGIIFGKNSDRPKGEVQELIYQPAQQHSAGDKLQVNIGNYIPSTQPRKTRDFISSQKHLLSLLREFAAKLLKQVSHFSGHQ